MTAVHAASVQPCMPDETRLYGLDGCPGGWVVASTWPDLTHLTVQRVVDGALAAFLRSLDETVGVMAIDIPIGFTERDARACDHAARRRLGPPRQNSVFSAPCRATLAALDYADACAINRQLRDRAISRQSWGIVAKMVEVDALLDKLPDLAARTWECHPEVTFAELTGEPRGIGASKKSASGRNVRLRLLDTFGLRVDLEGARHHLRGLRVGRDDIVDAAACLATAARLWNRQAIFLPAGPAQHDVLGRRMQIAA